jgi:hypothetical protein
VVISVGVYKIGIIACHIVLAIVCIVDIVFRFHGVLVLPVCVLTSVITLFLASKLAKAKQELMKNSKGVEEITTLDGDSEFENEVADIELNEED